MRRYLQDYSVAGIEYDFSDSLKGFLDNYNPMRNNYNGFLVHPPLDGFSTWVKIFKENVPENSRFALLTHDIGGSIVLEPGKKGTSIFDVKDIDGIKKYFGERR